VEKPERFLRRLFQAACGNHQGKVAEGHLTGFPELRHFPQPVTLADFSGWRMRSPIFAMGKIRRKFEADFKRQLIAQIEAGELSMAQAAREYQLAHSVLERWRTQYRSNALVDRPSNRERQLETENEKLKAKIGDLVMQMEHLKKLQAWVQQQRNVDTSVITAKNLGQFRKPAK
jgi:transposase-like protein